MELKTKRCIIREFKIEDIDSLMKYRNNENWMKYQEFKNKTKEEYIRILLKNNTFKEGKQLAIIYNNYLIGDLYVKEEDNEYWIGYTISPEFSQQGFAYETVHALINHLISLDNKDIKAEVHYQNENSIKLLKKLGFLKEKQSEEYIIYKYCCYQKKNENFQ